MLSFGDELCQYLAATMVSPSLTYGTNLFSGRLQDTPDLQAAIWVGPGAAPPLALGGPTAPIVKVDEPNVQVMVRGTLNGYAAAETMIQAIYKVLHSLDQVTLITNGLVVKASWAVQAPGYIGRDEAQRHLFVQNFKMLIENANR